MKITTSDHKLSRKIAHLTVAAILSITALVGAAPGASALFDCSQFATPDASPTVTNATPTPVDIPLDYAYLMLQSNLSQGAIDLASAASGDLDRPEVADFAASQIETATNDLETLNGLLASQAQVADASLNDMLATVDRVKADLDLPAGQGGTEAFDAIAGLGAICQSAGPYDDLYLAGALDLAQRQIDLAQVAVVAATDESVIAFANEIIERESATIGEIVLLQDVPDATPDA